MILKGVHTIGLRGKIMKEESYSKLALNAMHRASKEAIEQAASLNLKIPEWKDGKIIYVDAKEKLKNLSYSYKSATDSN